MAVDAFPEYQVTGAVHCYAAVKPHPTNLIAADYLYIGTAETHPIVNIIPLFRDIKNDTHGDYLPAQKLPAGRMAQITIPLNRMSNTTMAALSQLAAGVSREGRFERGRLSFGRITMQLWMVFENALDAGVRAEFPSLERGWWFPQVDPPTIQDARLGNRDRVRIFQSQALPYFVPQDDATIVGAAERTHLLYSSADAAFPAEVLVPQ